MVTVIVRHKVKDYDAWKPLFEEHGEVRRRYGATGHEIHRLASDPNDLIIVNHFSDIAGAQGFMSDPSLPETMARGGVASEPEITVCNQQEVAQYAVEVG